MEASTSNIIEQMEEMMSAEEFRYYGIRVCWSAPAVGLILPNSWHPAGEVEGCEEDTELDGSCCFLAPNAYDARFPMAYAESYWPDAPFVALIASDSKGESEIPEECGGTLCQAKVLAVWERC